jgi:hypothetical protein
MKKKVLLLIYLFPIYVFSQKEIYIKDFKTKKELPYATINFLQKNKGLYTNERGVFLLPEIKSDSIEISYIGYDSLKFKASKIKDTIFLRQSSIILSEIEINTGKSKEKVIGYIRKKKNLSWHIKKKTELATLIRYNKYYKDAYIKKIFIPISKEGGIKKGNIWESDFPDFRSVFRVHLYSNSEGKPNKSVLKNSILIECDQNSSNILEIDITDEFIKFPKEGVFVGVEMIGVLDNNGSISNNKSSILPSFKFTKKKEKNISSISYIKIIFLGNNWISIKNRKDFTHVSEYNMAVSLTLDIYKK